MSEYLSKKAVLEWLDDRRYKSPWIESFRDRLESGAFDADENEIQRLRAALVEIKQLLNENRENDGAFQNWNHMQAWKVATQALSTTTEPTGAAKVERELPTASEVMKDYGWRVDIGLLEKIQEKVKWYDETIYLKEIELILLAYHGINAPKGEGNDS